MLQTQVHESGAANLAAEVAVARKTSSGRTIKKELVLAYDADQGRFIGIPAELAIPGCAGGGSKRKLRPFILAIAQFKIACVSRRRVF